MADFSHGVAGPFATMYLADAGADVIKIERPGRGDASRYMTVSPAFGRFVPDVGGDYFLSINKNKRSVALDLKSEGGLAVALALAGRADVLVENFSPGTMDQLGLGYQAVRSVNPRIVYCSIKAFRPDSALAGESSMDVAIQAYSGLMAITGHPGGAPVKPGSSLADLSGGLHAFAAILLALLARPAAGGQHIDIALLDSTMAMLTNYSVPMLDSDVDIGPIGSGHPQLVPFQAFACSDGWIVIAAGTNGRWRKLCGLLGLERLQDDPKFGTNDARVRHRQELVPILEQALIGRSVAEWDTLLRAAGVPSAPIRSLREAFNDPDLERTGAVVTVSHPVLGPLRLLRNAIRVTGTGFAPTPPPVLGADTRAVLAGRLGLSDDQIDDLLAQGAIAEASV